MTYLEGALTPFGEKWLKEMFRDVEVINPTPLIKDGKIDRMRIKPYVEKRLVSERTFTPNGRDILFLYNYTSKTAYDKKWDEVTLQTRGLVVHFDGTVVIRPPKKFFNLEEHGSKDVPKGPIHIYEKVDGSLILASLHEEYGLVVASRGSFESWQALHARDLLLNRYGTDWIIPNMTYVFELIHPKNRIVVNYGDRDELVLLGGIGNKSGTEYSPYNAMFHYVPTTKAKRIATVSSYSYLFTQKQNIQPNEEGYVCVWENGFRLKIKSDEYLRLHRIVTNTNNKSIWELLAGGGSITALIDNTPDEFMWWVKNVTKELLNAYEDVERRHSTFVEAMKKKNLPRPKQSAYIYSSREPWLVPSVAFAMLDNKPYEKLIWKQLKPTEIKMPPVGEIDA